MVKLHYGNWIRRKILWLLGLTSLAIADPGARGLGQLQMAGQEVGVKVGVNHADDPQPVRRGVIRHTLGIARDERDAMTGAAERARDRIRDPGTMTANQND